MGVCTSTELSDLQVDAMARQNLDLFNKRVKEYANANLSWEALEQRVLNQGYIRSGVCTVRLKLPEIAFGGRLDEPVHPDIRYYATETNLKVCVYGDALAQMRKKAHDLIHAWFGNRERLVQTLKSLPDRLPSTLGRRFEICAYTLVREISNGDMLYRGLLSNVMSTDEFNYGDYGFEPGGWNKLTLVLKMDGSMWQTLASFLAERKQRAINSRERQLRAASSRMAKYYREAKSKLMKLAKKGKTEWSQYVYRRKGPSTDTLIASQKYMEMGSIRAYKRDHDYIVWTISPPS